MKAQAKLSKTAAQKLADAMRADPFIGPDSQIDWSGCPSVSALAETTFENEDFAPLIGSGGQDARALRAFVEQETARANAPGEVNLGKSVVGKIDHDGKRWRCSFTLQGKSYQTIGTTYEDCAVAASRFVFNSQPDNRELSEAEKLQVIRLCQAGDRWTAIGTYLRYRIGDTVAEKYDGPMEMMSDVKLLPVLNECAEFCWFHSTDDAENTEQWHAFKEEALAGRPATFDLLDAIWARYKQHVKKENRLAMFQPQPEPERDTREVAADLEEMSDAQIEATMKSVARVAAKRNAR